MTVKPGDIYAWSRTRPVTVTCLVCTASIVVGVDAHDAEVDDRGVELFACERCCETCREDPKAPSVGQRDILGRRLADWHADLLDGRAGVDSRALRVVPS